jgi:hypothetical protein
MKKLLLLCAAFVATVTATAQAFVLPSPTVATDSVNIYVDLSQTNGGLKTMLTNHPDYIDSVYMWTWQPSGPVCGNGDWGVSNECMKMQHVSGLIYTKKMFCSYRFLWNLGPYVLPKWYQLLSKTEKRKCI